MIQYKERIGFITKESKKGLDLYLLPNREYPEPELVLMVDPSEVTLAAIPNSMNEITGLNRLVNTEDVKAKVEEMLSLGHVVRIREGETREEALARGRAEIAKAAEPTTLQKQLAEDAEEKTDEVGRTDSEKEEVE